MLYTSGLTGSLASHVKHAGRFDIVLLGDVILRLCGDAQRVEVRHFHLGARQLDGLLKVVPRYAHIASEDENRREKERDNNELNVFPFLIDGIGSESPRTTMFNTISY